MISLDKYKSTDFSYKPKDRIANIITDPDEFKEICEFCIKLGHRYYLNPHGCLLYRIVIKDGWYQGPQSNSTLEIGCVLDTRIYKFVFWPGRETCNPITGLDALIRFRNQCGFIAREFEVTKNEEVEKIKQTIEKPWIKLTSIGTTLKGETLENIFHIDINSAYPAFLCKTYPQFYKYFNELYIHRKENEDNKAYLNYCIGAMHSTKIFGTRYPELARAAKNGTNRYLEKLTNDLQENGYAVIGYNTDGIFVWHPEGKLYHDADEGTAMGQWKIDHIYDKIRFKSAGAYEYIENGEYHACVRGIPRSVSEKFVWGDIFKHHPRTFSLIDGVFAEHTVDEEEFVDYVCQ